MLFEAHVHTLRNEPARSKRKGMPARNPVGQFTSGKWMERFSRFTVSSARTRGLSIPKEGRRWAVKKVLISAGVAGIGPARATGQREPF